MRLHLARSCSALALISFIVFTLLSLIYHIYQADVVLTRSSFNLRMVHLT